MIPLRTSERITFNQCPQKWAWAYLKRRSARTPSGALRFGTLVHKALEDFYLPGTKRGPKPAETFEREHQKMVREAYDQFGFRDEDGEWHNAGQLGVTMLENYHDTYGNDDRWAVVATEQVFWTEVLDENGKYLFTYVGVVDGVWRDRTSANKASQQQRWIVDHKTTKDDPTRKADALVMDDQAGAYWTFGVDDLIAQGLLKPRDVEGLTGMLYNFLRKGVPDDRPRNAQGQALNKPKKDDLLAYCKRKKLKVPAKATVADLTELIGTEKAAQLGEVSQKQPTPLLHREPVYRNRLDGESVRKRAIAQFKAMDRMRRKPSLIYKVPGTLHNPHCNWCEFRDACEIHEAQGDWKSVMKATTNKWNPYDQHEIYESR